MPGGVYGEILDRLRAQGFDMQRLVKTPQPAA